MKPTPYDALRHNPENWKWGVFYVCADDPHVIIPKRVPWMGWTLNFAHKKSYFILSALVLPAILVPIISSLVIK